VDCAALSACFIRDLAATIDGVAREGTATPYAVYTPLGSEHALRALLRPGFRLLPQSDGEFGARLLHAAASLLRAGHAGAILVNADSPTLPAAILGAAVRALRAGEDAVVLSPAFDGGYTLIGLSRPHARLFADIPWSTPQVHRLTVERAAEIGVPVVEVPGWYDVDDGETLRMLQSELAGVPPAFAEPGLLGAPAPATLGFLRERHAPAEARIA
jgi:glycosyltransferase A (GT-A) superfamily protein (DUF2064 family)